MRYRFYYELDKDEGSFTILEDGGGYELGAYFDVPLFWVVTEDDAIKAVKLLNKLYYEAHKND